ncbi:replication protein [Microvirgula aerodenitrificans]|uniref:replication protein n=1 Tax=Microvirgula aerodenitrificans TaxID=57480 RepID=UPI0028EB5323|nr:replication protein [Microvirgula aerodenitrificans]
MSMLPEAIVKIVASTERVPMNDGHIRIPNAVDDALQASSLTLHQYKVFRAVLRKTIGYSKPTDCISVSQISTMTNIDDAHIRRALTFLEEAGMLARGRRTRNGVFLTPNLDVSMWVPEQAKSARSGACSGGLRLSKQADSAPHNKQLQQTELQEANASLSPETDDVPMQSKQAQPRRAAVPCQQIVDAYNAELGSVLPMAQALNNSRRKALSARWAEMLGSQTPDGRTRYTDTATGLAWWTRFFRKVRLNPHWLGENDHGWTADLDWITGPKNFLKVLEYRPARKGEA